jgi:Na+:H+ antiporter
MHGGSEATFAIQLAVIVVCAKLAGRVFSRYLKQPQVLGEIAVGILIGPFALGGLTIPGLDSALFPLHNGEYEPSAALEGLKSVAAVVLLFMAGLETDIRKFLRFAAGGAMTGIGGALLSFVLGDLVTVWLGGAEGFWDPAALLMGTIATATSVGLTARILSEKHQMDSPEGATTLSAAVVDDVLGLIILGIVLSLAASGKAHGDSQVGASANAWVTAGLLIAKAVIFWVVCLGLGLLFSRHIAGFLRFFGGLGSAAGVALGLAMFIAGLAKGLGMELIIGAYVTGLCLSKTDIVHEIQDHLENIHAFMVPIFFCLIGMMVDVSKIGSVLVFGLVFTAACIIGKVLGCGLPAIPLGFNIRGAARIGVGMMPRQEVALIVAGVALKAGMIDSGALGAVILMVLITSVSAPPLLSHLFSKGVGQRNPADEEDQDIKEFSIELPGASIVELVIEQMVKAFRLENFYIHRLATGLQSYELRKDDKTVYMRADENRVVFSARKFASDYARLIALEEMITLEEVFGQASNLSDDQEIKRNLASGLSYSSD